MYRKWLVGGTAAGHPDLRCFPPLYGEGYEGVTSLMHGRVHATLFNNSLFYRFREHRLGGDPLRRCDRCSSRWWPCPRPTPRAAWAEPSRRRCSSAPFTGAIDGAAAATRSFGWHLSIASFTLVGMAGVMSGVMKAPLTSIFLIAELSSGYGLFIPLMIVGLHLVRRGLLPRPRLDLHQATAPAGRTADARQGPVGIRLPEARRSDGDRLPAASRRTSRWATSCTSSRRHAATSSP